MIEKLLSILIIGEIITGLAVLNYYERDVILLNQTSAPYDIYSQYYNYTQKGTIPEEIIIYNISKRETLDEVIVETPRITEEVKVEIPKEEEVQEEKEQRAYEISVSSIQNIINKIEGINKLPKEDIIVINFFDEEGAIIPNLSFIIRDGTVNRGYEHNYDIKITTGAYYVSELERAMDPCSVFEKIKENGDVKIQHNLGYLHMLKYYSLKKCVRF